MKSLAKIVRHSVWHCVTYWRNHIEQVFLRLQRRKCVCGKQKRYFKPNYRVFLTITNCFMCVCVCVEQRHSIIMRKTEHRTGIKVKLQNKEMEDLNLSLVLQERTYVHVFFSWPMGLNRNRNGPLLIDIFTLFQINLTDMILQDWFMSTTKSINQVWKCVCTTHLTLNSQNNLKMAVRIFWAKKIRSWVREALERDQVLDFKSCGRFWCLCDTSTACNSLWVGN